MFVFVFIVLIMLNTVLAADSGYKPTYLEKSCCEQYYAGDVVYYFNDVSQKTVNFQIGWKRIAEQETKTIEITSPEQCCDYVANRDACYACITEGRLKQERSELFDNYFWMVATVLGTLAGLFILIITKTKRPHLFKSTLIGSLIGGSLSLIFWLLLRIASILINQLHLYFFRHFTVYHWTLIFVYGFFVGGITGMVIKTITTSSRTLAQYFKVGLVFGILLTFVAISMNFMIQYYNSYRLSGQLGVDLGLIYYFTMPPSGWLTLIGVIVIFSFGGWFIGKMRLK